MTRITASGTRFALLGAAAIAVAMPAHAQSDAQSAAIYAASAAGRPAVNRHGPTERAQASESADGRLLCVRQEYTGSRMARRICHTQQEWEALGATVERR